MATSKPYLIDPMQTDIATLRARQQGLEKLALDPTGAITQGKDIPISVAGRNMSIVQPTQINYGGLAAKLGAGYLAGQQEETIRQKEQDLYDQRTQEITGSFPDDPKAQKLALLAARTGDNTALKQHLKDMAPYPLGAIMQGAYEIDEGVGNYIDSKQGWAPGTTYKMAKDAQERRKAKEQADRDVKVEVANIGDESRRAVAGINQAGKETTKEKEDAKLAVAANAAIPGMDNLVTDVEDIVKDVSKAQFYPGNLGMTHGFISNNPLNAKIEQKIESFVNNMLGGKYGAGISTADVDSLRRVVANLRSGNKEVAISQFNSFLSDMVTKRNTYYSQAGKEAPKFNITGPKSPYDSPRVKELYLVPNPGTEDIPVPKLPKGTKLPPKTPHPDGSDTPALPSPDDELSPEEYDDFIKSLPKK